MINPVLAVIDEIPFLALQALVGVASLLKSTRPRRRAPVPTPAYVRRFGSTARTKFRYVSAGRPRRRSL